MTRLAQIKKGALALPTKQRLQLVYQIWDSIAEESGVVEVAPEHLRLVREREAAHERDPSRVSTWPDVKRRIQKRLARARSTRKSA